MTTYPTDQIRRFVEAVDRHLDRPVRLVVIGGSAALLQHGATRTTRDIDTFDSDPSLISTAARAAHAELGFSVPVQAADIGDLPLNYEDRLLRPLPHLTTLELLVPERHDLTLSKLLRATEPDLQVCKQMHQHNPLSMPTLVHRYVHEMKFAIGRTEDHDMSFLAGVEFILGELLADTAEAMVAVQRAEASQYSTSSRRAPKER